MPEPILSTAARRVLDPLLGGLVALIGAILLTGGGIWSLHRAKLELSSPELWVLGALLLGALRLWLAPVPAAGPAPLWLRGSRAVMRALFASKFTEPARARRAAALGTALCFGTLALAHWFKHLSLETNAYDVSFVHQPLFSWPHCDFCLAGRPWAEHFTPLLAAMAVAFGWLRSDGLIFFLQALALAVPLYLGLTRGPLRGKPRLWLPALAVALALRSLRAGAVWDFREDDLGFAAGMLALLALERGNPLGYLGWLLAWCAAKENAALIALGAVIPILWDRELSPKRWTRAQRRSLAGATLLVTGSWTLFALGFALPHFGHGLVGSTQLVGRFPGLGATPLAVVGNLLTRPSLLMGLLAAHLFTISALKYFLFLLGPLLLFAARSPAWLLAAGPGLAMNLMSDSDAQRSLGYHYDLMLLPFLIWGTWRGIARLGELAASTRRIWATGLVIALALSGPWPGRELTRHWPSSAARRDQAYLQSLPSDPAHDPPSAGDWALAQLSRFSTIREILPAVTADPARIYREAGVQAESDARPCRRVYESRRAILDASAPSEAALGGALEVAGWRRISASPSGRFTEWVRD